MSTRLFKISSQTPFVAAAFAVMAVLAMPASADTSFQDQPYSVVGTSGTTSSTSLTWNKFDPAAGTLTGVSLTVNGTSSGSIDVTNLDVDAINLSDFFNRVRLTFSGTGSKPGAQTTNNTAIVSNPVIPTAPGTYSLAGESAQTFALNPASQELSGLTNSLNAFLAYFTGPGTFSTSLVQLPAVASSNGGFTSVDNSSLATFGNVGIVYTFTPVPEPSTYALAAAGLGVAAFMRHRRRKCTA